MAAKTTKYDVYEAGSSKYHIWKSITLNSLDTLVSGFKDVWMVFIQDPTKWSTPSWTVSTDGKGIVTFTLTGAYTGRVVILGR
jgi:hypothetical protein